MALAVPGSSANFASKRSVATTFSVPSEMSRADSSRICRQMPTWIFLGLHRRMAVRSFVAPRFSGQRGMGRSGTPE
ncbi:hypothetical protein MYXA107069_37125 [Myxococcus xanthus]|uniref:Uncharacterized protein n=1 Tax=Corallococcus macrosporus DSM 14697 TaxID=1189310 RepID=A0A250JS81_9BACT|nr:hypothetical protein MYMAC_001919 [Corallococcus macrosporus DSM 14697]QZZ49382.1 hypothetical protein MyxoNM_09235 [Myxococcus xanthus]